MLGYGLDGAKNEQTIRHKSAANKRRRDGGNHERHHAARSSRGRRCGGARPCRLSPGCRRAKLERPSARAGRANPRAALEAIALEGYRERKLSAGQLRRLLGYRTRVQVHAFLKAHGVYLDYGIEDLEHDRNASASIPSLPT